MRPRTILLVTSGVGGEATGLAATGRAGGVAGLFMRETVRLSRLEDGRGDSLEPQVARQDTLGK